MNSYLPTYSVDRREASLLENERIKADVLIESLLKGKAYLEETIKFDSPVSILYFDIISTILLLKSSLKTLPLLLPLKSHIEKSYMIVSKVKKDKNFTFHLIYLFTFHFKYNISKFHCPLKI